MNIFIVLIILVCLIYGILFVLEIKDQKTKYMNFSRRKLNKSGE